MPNPNQVVSFDDEPLILVDANDQIIGYKPKLECHQGQGILHRAFSIFLFNSNGELLIQQRSPKKMLWPGIWANSCCSHPRQGETTLEAAQRRLQQEVGIFAELTFLYKFEYHATYQDIGSEHELCSVFIGVSDDQVRANRHEIGAWGFVPPEFLDNELKDNPEVYSPWLKLEWPDIRQNYWPQVQALL